MKGVDVGAVQKGVVGGYGMVGGVAVIRVWGGRVWGGDSLLKLLDFCGDGPSGRAYSELDRESAECCSG